MTCAAATERMCTVDLSFSPYDYEFHNDQYLLYTRWRAETPVYRNEELDFWALSRYGDMFMGDIAARLMMDVIFELMRRA
jgi:hypothetical protein